MRKQAGASVVVAWHRKSPLPAASWGVPLLLACSVGVTKSRSAHGTPLSAPGRWRRGSSARSGIRASELRRKLRAEASLIAFPLYGKGAKR